MPKINSKLRASSFVVLLFLFFTVSHSQSKVDSLKQVVESSLSKEEKLHNLDELTKELIRQNDTSQNKFLGDYIELARELEEYDLMASKSRFLAQNYLYDAKPNDAFLLIDSLLRYKPLFKKSSSEGHLILKRGAANYNTGNFSAAADDYKSAAKLFMVDGDSIFAADAYYFGGQVYSDLNAFTDAVNYYEKAITLYDLLDDKKWSTLAQSDLISLYNMNGFVEKSQEEQKRLLKEAQKDGDYSTMIQLLGKTVTSYYRLEDYEKMNATIDQIEIYNDSIESPRLSTYLDFFAVNYRVLYVSKSGDLDRAKTLVSKLDSLYLKIDSPIYHKADVLNAKASYFTAENNLNALVPILEELVGLNNPGDLQAQIKARQQLADIYVNQGKFKESSELLNRNIQVKDSIYTSQKVNTFLYYQTQFDTQKKQQELDRKNAEIARYETEKRITRIKRNILLIGVISIFVVLIGFFYFRNRQKIKEQAYQNILLNNKIATKTEEINSLLSETIQHIKSKERIAENLQKLSTENEGITLKSIIADLKASKADNAKLMLIKQNIEQVNFEFIKKLKSMHPNLTKTDIEICSLIRIGLSRKEVANLRNTSIEAVKSSRFRLKKKLGLSSNTSLDDYINTL